jgi:hypothetical protein
MSQHRTIHGEDAYRVNVRLHCCAVQVKRKAISVVLSEHGHRQGHFPSGSLVLLVLRHIAAALARTN